MTSVETKILLLEFIRTYRSLPALWDVNSKDYNNRQKKCDGYDKLIPKLKRIEPYATRETVVRKINSLRSNFRKELRKVEDSMRSGKPADEVYKPTLWYFNEFLFLTEQEIPLGDERKMPTDDDSSITENMFTTYAASEHVMDQEIPEQQRNKRTSPGDNIIEQIFTFADASEHQSDYDIIPDQRKKRVWRDNTTKDISALVGSNYRQNQEIPEKKRKKRTHVRARDSNNTNNMFAYAVRHLEKEDDEFLIMAKCYAQKLKKMESNQRLYADRLINEVLLEGQLGTLERYSTIINSSDNISQRAPSSSA